MFIVNGFLILKLVFDVRVEMDLKLCDLIDWPCVGRKMFDRFVNLFFFQLLIGIRFFYKIK